MTYRSTTVFLASSFSFANQYSLGGGFPFPIVLVPRYNLSLCHTPIKPDLLGFPGIGVFMCGLLDHVITRFASDGTTSEYNLHNKFQWQEVGKRKKDNQKTMPSCSNIGEGT
jgi:hypothetical protein